MKPTIVTPPINKKSKTLINKPNGLKIFPSLKIKIVINGMATNIDNALIQQNIFSINSLFDILVIELDYKKIGFQYFQKNKENLNFFYSLRNLTSLWLMEKILLKE